MVPSQRPLLFTLGAVVIVSVLAFGIASLNDGLRLPICLLFALLSIALVARDLIERKKSEHAIARLAAIVVVFAGIADALENFNLTRLLIDAAPGSALAAALAASAKFALLAVALGVLVLAAAARLMARLRA